MEAPRLTTSNQLHGPSCVYPKIQAGPESHFSYTQAIQTYAMSTSLIIPNSLSVRGLLPSHIGQSSPNFFLFMVTPQKSHADWPKRDFCVLYCISFLLHLLQNFHISDWPLQKPLQKCFFYYPQAELLLLGPVACCRNAMPASLIQSKKWDFSHFACLGIVCADTSRHATGRSKPDLGF